MENGKFAKEERERVLALDAVDEVRASSIVYSKQKRGRAVEGAAPLLHLVM